MRRRSFLAFLSFFMLTTFSLSITSCSDDDDDKSSSVSNDPEGTILININNNGGWFVPFMFTGAGFNVPACTFYMDKNNNLCNSNGGEIVSLGKVKGISSIYKLPELGWTNKVALVPGYGYIIRDSYQGLSGCIRIYAVEYIKNTYNEIIGAVLKYQEWEP